MNCDFTIEKSGVFCEFEKGHAGPCGFIPKNARYDNGWYYCWLIELRGSSQPMWWAAEGGWEENANDALWFARREDADRFASEMSQDVIVCEHGFMLATPSVEPSKAPAGTAEVESKPMRRLVTLNDYQLLRAVDLCGGIFTGSEVTIEHFEAHECDEDGEKVARPAGYYLYWTEYPEEGSTQLDDGPLTESFECIVCHVCGNERTIANGATGTDPRGYSDCSNCSDHKGPPA